MAVKALSEFLSAFSPLAVRRVGDPLIRKLIFDSREAEAGALFFALTGTHTDGHRFIPEVVARGVEVVVHSQDLEFYDPRVTYIQVPDTRFVMSPAAAAFFDHPSRELRVIGVTGTDGKSSTVSFIHQLLEAQGLAAGFFSTVQWKVADAVEANSFRQSTPEAPQIQGVLREMRDHGKEFAVVESTSHGLSARTNRLGDVAYDVAVLTNVTIEHLEFHGTLENYRRDKSRLFSALDTSGKGGYGVLNLDDPHHELFRQATARPCRTYGVAATEADLRASEIREAAGGLEFRLHWGGGAVSARMGLSGRFNVENAMASLLAVAGLVDREPLDLVPLLEGLRPVKGRMVPVRQGQPFQVLIDYAHTPGAFEKVLPAAREVTQGRLLVVFGSGGERDHEKRPLQGALADRWADVVILTDEDPRKEGSEPVLREIAAGIRNKIPGESLFQVTPRRSALEKAFSLARPGDTVLLLGKGHEQSIIYADRTEKYDEETAAREILSVQGWAP